MMNKYIMKKNIADEIHRKYKINNFAKRIGITRQTLSAILAGSSHCNYPLAFTITKTININADIKNFFEEI